MDRTSLEEILLTDPLSEITRGGRTRLLLSTLVAWAIGKAKILPTKIDTLGITFTTSDRNAILALTGVVVAYFLVEFAIYAFFDILRNFIVAGHENVREISELEEKYPGEKFGFSPTLKVSFC